MKLRDIKLDSHNANKGTARGQKQLVGSIQRNGFGRSGLLDKSGTVIAGNKSTEAAAEVFGIEVEPIIVETDGSRPVYVQRIDLDLSDTDPNNPARRLAYEDNRSSELGLSWDAETILADLDSGFDLSDIFYDNELSEFQDELSLLGELSQGVSSPRQLGDKKKQIKPVLYSDEIATFEAAILETGIVNRGEAVIEICQFYLDATLRLRSG